MNGGGNVNLWKNVDYETDLYKWHFIYYSYSRAERTTFGFIEFHDRLEHVEWSNVN